MSVSNIQANVQSTEQYKIRKQTETKQAEELQQIQQAQQAAVEIQKVDEYDKENPVGEEVEGIYSVSSDESRNLKIDYKQPGSKTSDEKETMQVKANEKTDSAKSAGAAPAAGKTEESSESDDDDNEEELEKLKQQRDVIKQQLNSAADEETKAALRAQLQAIEVQIALKSSETN